MDEEDDAFMATMKREEGKGSIGSDSERSSIDPAKMSEDDDNDERCLLLDEVKDADTAKDTEAWIQIESTTIHHVYFS